jgi:hypothetical protein
MTENTVRIEVAPAFSWLTGYADGRGIVTIFREFRHTVWMN